MLERIKNLLLFLLALLSIVQFAILVGSGQNPVRVVQREAEVAVEEATAEEVSLTAILAVAPRIIAHVPDAPSLIGDGIVSHILLRDGSRFYPNIWNRAADVLSALPQINGEQLSIVDEEVWNPEVYSIELILSHPTSLGIYLGLLGVAFEGSHDPTVDRIYISAVEDDSIYISDISGVIYQGPWKARSSIFLAALKACEVVTSFSVRSLNLEPLGLVTYRDIYVFNTPGNVAPWTLMPVLNEESFSAFAPLAFSDPASLRIAVYEGAPFFEDTRQRLRLNGTQLVLERWPWNVPYENETPGSLQHETATFLQSLDLWPEKDLLYDGIGKKENGSVVFFQQVYEGKPLFYLEPGQTLVQSTLRAEECLQSLVAMKFRPHRFRNALLDQKYSVQSQEQILQSFVAAADELPLNHGEYNHAGRVILRDIYEGFLYVTGSNAVEVWVVETVDGSRYLFDMVTSELKAYMPSAARR